MIPPATPSVPVASAAERLAEALADRLRRDVAWVAMLTGLALAAAAEDALAGVPQALAAAALLLVGARAEVLRLGVLGRAVVLAGCGLVAWASASEPRALLAGFLGLVTATTLLQPKGPREQGLVLATGLLQAALAAILSLHPLLVLVGLLFVLLAHRALGTFHRLRAARRTASAGGVVVAPATESEVGVSSLLAAGAVLAAAVPLFLVIPRAQVPLFSLQPAGGLTTQALSDEMRLGGAPRLVDGDETLGDVAPRNAAARARSPYLRVDAFEDFEGGRTWRSARRDPVESPEVEPLGGTVSLAGTPAGEGAAEFAIRFPTAAAPRLPVPEGVTGLAFRDPLPHHVSVYETGAIVPRTDRPASVALFTATAGPLRSHAGFGPAVRAPDARCLRVPAGLASDLRAHVADAIGAASTPREKARALESWVRARCAYSLTRAPTDRDAPIVDFLERTRSGHCEYFAAALAACLRVAGIPSRVVSGFHASRWNDKGGGFWLIRRRDAHAWVEAWIRGEGWVRLDATPYEGLESEPYTGFLGFLARLRDAVSFEWNRRVLGYDREAQQRSFDGIAAALSDAWARARSAAPGIGGVLGTAAALGALGLLARRRRRRRRGPRARSSVAFYDRVLSTLRRRGLEKRPHETARDFARRAGPGLSSGARAAIGEVTGAFEAARYGGAAVPTDDRSRPWVAALSARR